MIDHFTWLAPFYEKVIPPPDPDEILELLQPHRSGGQLLDAGGGTARVSGQLTDYYDEVVIADLNRAMLRQTKEKQKVQPVCAHVEALPFPDGYFSNVLIIDALHHFCDQTESLREAVRVLKKRGRLVIGEPDINNIFVKGIALFEKLALMRSRFLAPEAIKGIVDSFGFHAEITRDNPWSAWITVVK